MNPESGRAITTFPFTAFEAEDGAGAAAPGGGEEQAPAENEVQAPDVTSPEDEAALPEGVEAPFKIEDLPPDQQEVAKQLDRQWKGTFSRWTQENSARIVDSTDAELVKKLDTDEGGEALTELADRYGWEAAEKAAEGTKAEAGEVQDEYSHLDPVVAEKLREHDRAQREMSERQSEADRNEQIKVIRSHIEAGQAPLLERKGGLGEEGMRAFTLLALDNPGANGLPNTELAAAMVEKIEAGAVQRYKDSLGGGGPPPPVSTGGNGVRQPDRSTAAGRRALGEQVAARHYQS